tara:strand:- start:95 stop:499 length:405 start_codon:yes stop_codon:yes gene_type:complete
MSTYNGKIWNRSPVGVNTIDRLVDIQIPNEVMDALYIPLDGKVFISNGENFTAKLKLDSSEGGRELQLGMRVDGELVTNGWWENKNKVVQKTIREVPNDVLSFLGLGYADDQIEIKYTVDTSTWSATLEKVSVI